MDRFQYADLLQMIRSRKELILWVTLWFSHLGLAQQSEVTEGTVERTVNSPVWTVFPSAIIAGLGVIFNLLSLSYFIRREHDSLGKFPNGGRGLG